MITIDVHIDATDLKQLYADLSPAQFRAGVSRGINRTLEIARTVSRTAVKEVYTIAQSALPKRIDTTKSTTRTMTGMVTASPKPVPMDDFKIRFTSSAGGVTTLGRRRTKDGRIAKTSVKKTTRKLGTLVIEAQRGKKEIVPYAFLLPTLSSRVFGRGFYKPGGGTWGFRVRNSGETRPRTNSGGANEKVTPLTSVTVYAAAINPKTQMKIRDRVEPIFLDKIIHELNFKRGMYAPTP